MRETEDEVIGVYTEQPLQQAGAPGLGEARWHDRQIGQRYQLCELIHERPGGAVFIGRDLATEQAVIVKLCHDPESAQAAQLLAEAQLLQRIEHPNVVRLLDHGVEPDGVAFLITPFVEGRPLSADLTQIEPVILMRRCGQILQGLRATHEAGVGHQDLQPEHVLISAQEDITLIGFSHAARLDAGTSQAPPTTAYTAPERAHGPTSAQGDLYSVGVILYEGLAGRPPFSGEAPRRPQPPPLPYRGDLPSDLYALIGQALASSPEVRPASAADMAQRLCDLPWPELGATTLRAVHRAHQVAQQQARPAPKAPTPAPQADDEAVSLLWPLLATGAVAGVTWAATHLGQILHRLLDALGQ